MLLECHQQEHQSKRGTGNHLEKDVQKTWTGVGRPNDYSMPCVPDGMVRQETYDCYKTTISVAVKQTCT